MKRLLLTPYAAILRRDLRLGLLRGSEGMTTLFFFAVTCCLFPVALGGDPALVRKAASGIIWVSAALAALLSLEALYHRDAEDGTFDLLMLSPLSPLGLVLAKMLAHWMVAGLALALISLVVAPMLFIPLSALGVLILGLALGTLYMSLIGGMGAVLTFGARRPGLLLVLIVLPLYLPMLILGVGGLDAAMAGLPAAPYLILQLALVIAALPLAACTAGYSLFMNMRS